MDTLFEKLDRLSNPLGSLLDAALNRLAPHTTASACGGHVCRITCTGRCGGIGNPAKTIFYAPSAHDCSHGIRVTRCPAGCC